jgi:hypothetical protein
MQSFKCMKGGRDGSRASNQTRLPSAAARSQLLNELQKRIIGSKATIPFGSRIANAKIRKAE